LLQPLRLIWRCTQNQHYLSKCFSLLTGFQTVFVQRVFHDIFASPTLGNQSHRENYHAFNPELGIAYEWNKVCLAYANVSRSFPPPSFDESLRVQEGMSGGEVFNPLQAQSAITLELGTRREVGPVSWDVAVYRSWVRNELLDLNNNLGQPLGTVDAPRTVHQGIELQLDVELARIPCWRMMRTKKKTDRIILVQSYTLNDFRFRHDTLCVTGTLASELNMNLGAQTNQSRLAKQVRLRSDPASDRAVLLHQEAVILPNYSRYGILRLRDGKHTLSEVI
jgi:outer membrane receptor protein involved in Fe transport